MKKKRQKEIKTPLVTCETISGGLIYASFRALEREEKIFEEIMGKIFPNLV